MQALELSWDDFDDAIEVITASTIGNTFSGVYGIPRGGLPLAVALSHHLCVPLLSEPKNDCLIIDDIRDSGATLASVSAQYPKALKFVWATRERRATDYSAALTDIGSRWVIFPWEDRARATEDFMAYQARRK